MESMSISAPRRPVSFSRKRSIYTGPKGVRSYFVDPRGRVSRSGRPVKVPRNVAELIAETAAKRNAKRVRASARIDADELADLLAGKTRLDPIEEDE